MSAAGRTKRAALERLYAAWRKETAETLVCGDGNPDGRLVFVGEAPGAQEVREQKPFVGKAGENLTETLQLLELTRDDIFITNAVKFRPTRTHPERGSLSNRPPAPAEVSLWQDRLYKELLILQPRLVVSLGNVPLKVLARDGKASIGAVHGTPLDIAWQELRYTLFPLYHPASVIYRRELAEVFRKDALALKRYLAQNE